MLHPIVNAAVLKVVDRLRDPHDAENLTRIGFMILDAMGRDATSPSMSPLGDVRAALGITCTLSEWAAEQSRESVATALETIARRDSTQGS